MTETTSHSVRMAHWSVQDWEIRIIEAQIRRTFVERNESVMQRQRCRWATAARRRLAAAAA